MKHAVITDHLHIFIFIQDSRLEQATFLLSSAPEHPSPTQGFEGEEGWFFLKILQSTVELTSFTKGADGLCASLDSSELHHTAYYSS